VPFVSFYFPGAENQQPADFSTKARVMIFVSWLVGEKFPCIDKQMRRALLSWCVCVWIKE